MLWFWFRLKIDFNFQNVSCAPNFLSSQASAAMGEVIYSAPLASMGEVIHSASGQKLSPSLFWQPWMKSSIVPPSSRDEVILSANGPLAKGLEYLSFSDRNTCLFCSIVADIFKCIQMFSTRLLTLPCSFACAAGVKTSDIKTLEETQYPQSKQLNLALHSRLFRSYPSTSSRTWRACLQ